MTGKDTRQSDMLFALYIQFNPIQFDCRARSVGLPSDKMDVDKMDVVMREVISDPSGRIVKTPLHGRTVAHPG